MTVHTIPEPCTRCSKPRGTPTGCGACQWTGEADPLGPAEGAEHAWLELHRERHGTELGDCRPGSLICPAAWNGHGSMVGCSGAIENGRGVTREFAPTIVMATEPDDITPIEPWPY